MSKFIDYFNGLTQDTDPQGDSDFIMTYDTSTSGIKKVLITDFGFLTSGLSTDTKLDDLSAPDDNADLDATTSAHGLLMKLSGDSDQYLNGDGEWTEPAGSGGGFTTGDIHMVELYRGELTTDGNFSDTDISQDYDHLLIRAKLKSSVNATNDAAYMYFNADTTAGNYRHGLQYSGTAGGVGTGDTPYIGDTSGATSTANDFSIIEIYIPNYTNGHVKSALGRTGVRRDATNIFMFNSYMNWENTAAITQITIQPDGYATDKFITGSWLQIIGVKTEA